MILKKAYRILLLSILCMTVKQLNAQIVISPTQSFQNEVKADDFLYFMISNLDNTDKDVFFKILIRSAEGHVIAEGISTPTKIKANYQGFIQGLSYSTFVYKNAKYASLIRKSNGVLPPGSYRIQIIAVNGQTHMEEGSESITADIELMNPPILVTPFHQEELEIMYPNFTWLPPAPVSPTIDVDYEIKVVEIKSGQNASTAILSNPAVYKQKNIRSLRLNYPVGSYSFDKEKQYAWQITAFAEGIYIGKSEVWLFKFKKENNPNPIRSDNDQAYILLKKGSNSGVYLAINSIKFHFNEEYNSGELSYRFRDSENKDIKLTSSAKKMKQPGPNKFEIDLYEEEAFKHGKYYSLEVRSEKMEIYKIYFKYLRSSK
jgi:hypothetical protein